jgi:hypothetical protein
VGAGSGVAGGQGFFNGPVLIDGAARGDDGAEGVLKAFAVVGLFADGDVGE